MKPQNVMRVNRLNYLKSLKSDIERAEVELHQLVFCGLPSSPESRRLTFACILNDFYRYLELGGTQGYVGIQSFTSLCGHWLKVIEKYSRIAGFPEHLIERFQVAVEWGDVRGIAQIVSLASKALQGDAKLA